MIPTGIFNPIPLQVAETKYTSNKQELLSKKSGLMNEIMMYLIFIVGGIYILWHLIFIPMEIMSVQYLLASKIAKIYCVLLIIGVILKDGSIGLAIYTAISYKRLLSNQMLNFILAGVLLLPIGDNTYLFVYTITHLEEYGFTFLQFVQEPMFWNYVGFMLLALITLIWLLVMGFTFLLPQPTQYIFNIPQSYSYIAISNQVYVNIK